MLTNAIKASKFNTNYEIDCFKTELKSNAIYFYVFFCTAAYAFETQTQTIFITLVREMESISEK